MFIEGPHLTRAQVTRLHEALELLGGVADAMNVSSEQCPTCHAERQINRHQSEIATTLEAVIARLDSILDGEPMRPSGY